MGGNETYDDIIPVYDSISFSGVVKDGVLHTVNGKGQLLAYNGKAMEEIDVFPVYSVLGKKWDDGNSPRNCISPHGS